MYFPKTNSSNRIIPIFLLVFIFIFSACKHKVKVAEVDTEFGKYIDAYTSGVISKKNTIRIQLASDGNITHSVNETIKEELFTLSPNVEGKAFWVD